MTKANSVLYRTAQQNLEELFRAEIKKGLERIPTNCTIFFRADDIGIPSKNFQSLIQCFQHHKLPLCLATVPSWLNENRLDALSRITGKGSTQWCWHQHGATHRNYESSGKKQEFGPSRSSRELQKSLLEGKNKLITLFKDDFFPVFTPPWNRCSQDTIDSLIELDFKAISRNKDARPKSPPLLPDLSVNVDLHTRKEATIEHALVNFRQELSWSISSGFCGIMIHHQRMNNRAFHFLDILLGVLKQEKNIVPVHFKDFLS